MNKGRRPRCLDAGLGLLAAALILAGCSSAGPAGAGTTTTASGGCPRHLPADELCADAPLARVEGVLETVGGPAPGRPEPVSGSVVITRPGGTTTRVTVGSDGRFSLHLARGTYAVSGSFGGQRLPCTGATLHVDPPSHVTALVNCPVR